MTRLLDPRRTTTHRIAAALFRIRLASLLPHGRGLVSAARVARVESVNHSGPVPTRHRRGLGSRHAQDDATCWAGKIAATGDRRRGRMRHCSLPTEPLLAASTRPARDLDRQRAVLEALDARTTEAGLRDIVAALGAEVPVWQIKDNLAVLKRLGLVWVRGHGRAAKWILLPHRDTVEPE